MLTWLRPHNDTQSLYADYFDFPKMDDVKSYTFGWCDITILPINVDQMFIPVPMPTAVTVEQAMRKKRAVVTEKSFPALHSAVQQYKKQPVTHVG